MAAHLYIHALYELYTYSNLISAACTSSIHCVRTTHDPGYVVWFIRPVIIRVKGNYPCATIAAIFDPQNPCNCGGVFTLSMRHRSIMFIHCFNMDLESAINVYTFEPSNPEHLRFGKSFTTSKTSLIVTYIPACEHILLKLCRTSAFSS